MAGPYRYQHVTSAELETVAAVAQPLKKQDLYAERLYLDWRHSKIAASPEDPEVTTWPAQVNGILELPMAQFAKELRFFWVEIRTRKGEIYGESTLEALWNSFQRILRQDTLQNLQNLPLDQRPAEMPKQVVLDKSPMFQEAHAAYTEARTLARRNHKGKGVHKADVITPEMRAQFLASDMADKSSAEGLFKRLVWLFLMATGRRGYKEVHDTTNCELSGPFKDTTGAEYVLFAEDFAKTNRVHTPVADRREPLPIYDANFIEAYLEYVSKKIPGGAATANFFTGKLNTPVVRDGKTYWYHKDMAPHSPRVTMVNALSRSGMPREAACKITGHTDPKAFEGYIRPDDVERQHVSDIVSGTSKVWGDAEYRAEKTAEKRAKTSEPPAAEVAVPEPVAPVPEPVTVVDDDIDDDFIQEVAKLEAAAVSQSSITKAVKESDAWLTPDVLSEIDGLVATHTGATFTGNPVFNVTIKIPPK
eukprot:jgi/Mesvir1/8668/Mv02608-RA.1